MIVGISKNGDFIVSKTSSVGKTEMQLQELAQLHNMQAEEITACIEVFRKACMVYAEICTKILDAFRQALQPIMQEAAVQKKSVAEMLEEIYNAFSATSETLEEKSRVKEAWRQQAVNVDGKKMKPRQQALSKMKFRPYELRVYYIVKQEREKA